MGAIPGFSHPELLPKNFLNPGPFHLETFPSNLSASSHTRCLLPSAFDLPFFFCLAILDLIPHLITTPLSPASSQQQSHLTCKQSCALVSMGAGDERKRQARRARHRDHGSQGNSAHTSDMDLDPTNQKVSPFIIQHWYASFFSDPAKAARRERE